MPMLQVKRSVSEGETVMACEIALPPVSEPNSAFRPALTSYDTGFEHSLEHLIEVRRMVEEADQEPQPARMQLRGILAA